MNNTLYKEALFDEVFDSQKNFRILLDAMSRPGKVYRLYYHSFGKYPKGFNPNVLTILKTLCDNNVTFYSYDRNLEDYIRTNTGSEPAETIGKADYALFDGPGCSGCFKGINTGTIECPEDGTTAIITVKSISEGECLDFNEETVVLRLRGPGIKNVNTLFVNGLDSGFADAFTELNKYFPLGTDAILVDRDGYVSCLARTTQLEVA